MKVFFDIETIPTSNQAIKDAFLLDAQTNFKAPSDLTKERAAAELGMTDAGEIKFTSKNRMIELWEERFAKEAAPIVADEKWRKTSFDGALGHICVIGWAIENQPSQYLYGMPDHEASMLSMFYHSIDEAAKTFHTRPLFIGHNIVNFDFNFMRKRSIVLSSRPSNHIHLDAKIWSEHVYDTMHQWDSKNSISLDNLCKALGIPGKGEIDGSMVWDLVNEGRLKDVAKYCADDVDMVRNVYNRMTFQQPEPELEDILL